MSDPEFIANFISECARNSVDVLSSAKSEIENIDELLNNAELLKIRRMKLVSVLDHLGDDTYRRRRASYIPVTEDIDFKSPEHKDLIDKIIRQISFGPISVNNLIPKVGSYDNDYLILRAVKWLGEQEIISRDSEKRLVLEKKDFAS